jgi:hypothetical protein
MIISIIDFVNIIFITINIIFKIYNDRDILPNKNNILLNVHYNAYIQSNSLKTSAENI